MKLSLLDKVFIVGAVDEARANGARLDRSCLLVGLTLRTLQRWRRHPQEDQRQGPKIVGHALSESEKAEIIRVSNTPRYRDLSPRMIVPMLADEGIYIASESAFYAVLKAAHLMRGRGRQRQNRNVARPLAVIALKPNSVWSWDITFMKSAVKGAYYYLYLVMDVFSRMIVGWKVMDTQSSEYGADLVREACLRFNIKPEQLILHADNGGPMKGATMLATLQKLGVIPSFSRPAVSDDNPYSEALFKTLKYCPKYPRNCFKGIDEARVWVKSFVQWYNHEHLHSEIKYVTPAMRHAGNDLKLLTERKEVYLRAQSLNPMRWKSGIRNWDVITEVPLNHINGRSPEKQTEILMAVRTA